MEEIYPLLKRVKINLLRYKIALIYIISLSSIILISTMFMLWKSWFWVWFIILYFVVVFSATFIPIISNKLHKAIVNNRLPEILLGIRKAKIVVIDLKAKEHEIEIKDINRIRFTNGSLYSQTDEYFYIKPERKGIIYFYLKNRKKIKTYYAINPAYVCLMIRKMVKTKNYDINKLKESSLR